MGMHADEVFEEKDLPKRYLGFSPCYRREAGAHSKDVKGLIRVHEFFKFEQLILCPSDHETSVSFHEELNRNIEEFIETLGIPYHTVVNCGSDLGLGQVKKYDVELWVPKENKYREIGSASYFHDFQCRRLNIRYKDKEGKLRYAHSLQCHGHSDAAHFGLPRRKLPTSGRVDPYSRTPRAVFWKGEETG